MLTDRLDNDAGMNSPPPDNPRLIERSVKTHAAARRKVALTLLNEVMIPLMLDAGMTVADMKRCVFTGAIKRVLTTLETPDAIAVALDCSARSVYRLRDEDGAEKPEESEPVRAAILNAAARAYPSGLPLKILVRKVRASAGVEWSLEQIQSTVKNLVVSGWLRAQQEQESRSAEELFFLRTCLVEVSADDKVDALMERLPLLYEIITGILEGSSSARMVRVSGLRTRRSNTNVLVDDIQRAIRQVIERYSSADSVVDPEGFESYVDVGGLIGFMVGR